MCPPPTFVVAAVEWGGEGSMYYVHMLEIWRHTAERGMGEGLDGGSGNIGEI
jgi:hypothetical protein